MRAVLAQLAPVPGSPTANANRAAEVIRGSDTDLVVFPELWLSGYDLRDARATGIEIDSPEVTAVCAAAGETQTAVALGFVERRGDAVADSVALISESGAVAEVYRKVQLFGDEVAVFEPGEATVVATLAGRRVGPLICFDMEFPELARALALTSADVLVTVAANMAPFYAEDRIASQARALDDRLPHLYCNRCGDQRGLHFVGGSRALSADGEVLAETFHSAECLLAVPAPAPGSGDARVNYLTQLRDEISVKALTRPRGGIA